MDDSDRLQAEIDTLRTRLRGLAEAILRISENLEFDSVLQEVVDSARALTGARFAMITTVDTAGGLQDLLFSGFSKQDRETLLGYGAGMELFDFLGGLAEPPRTGNFLEYAESVGFGDFEMQVGPLCGSWIEVRGRRVGCLYVADVSGSNDFTGETEEILEMFASQAALALTNARRHGEERQAKAEIEALVDASPVGVLVVDVLAGNTVVVNQEARRLLRLEPEQDGYSVASLEQLRCKRMDGTEIAFDELPFEPAMLDGRTVHAEELLVVHPDGSETATLVNATPLLNDHEELVTVIATLQDLTPLEELERLRAEFLAMVSHELRGPLTSIKGSAVTMGSAVIPPDPDEVRQFSRIIEEQADAMRDLINDLLDMTRIESGILSVAPEPVDTASVIGQAKNAFVDSGHRHSIEIELAPNLPSVWCDRQRIVQVLHNLFSNAAKNSPEWSTISVRASLDDAHVTVSVTDQGVGIDPEHLPLLFIKFSSGIGGASGAGRDQVGHGLGLAICKGIVEAHGGRIWAHSAGRGRGAQFTFSLPVLAESAPSVAAPDADERRVSQTPASVERILVVDDDPQALRFVRTTLQRAGYTPIATTDPDQIPHLLQAEQPHLVLLDVVLPGTDGFALARRIPKMLEVPVIFISGRDDDHFITTAFEIGAADYIVKPFSPTELLARISAALRRHVQSQYVDAYRHADLTVDYLTRTVAVSGRPVSLTPTEYQLLSVLCTNAGRALTYDQLLEHLWGKDSSGDAQRVRTFVKALRAKLGDNARSPTYILTVPNIGYSAPAP